MAYSFKLSFTPSIDSDVPLKPFWCIRVGARDTDPNRNITITPTYCIENDIDEEIDNLISQLNRLRRKAKKQYKTWGENNYKILLERDKDSIK